MTNGFYCVANGQVVRPGEVAEFFYDSVPVVELDDGRFSVTDDEGSSERLLCDYPKDFYSAGRAFTGGMIYSACEVVEVEHEEYGTLVMIDGAPYVPHDKVGVIELDVWIEMQD